MKFLLTPLLIISFLIPSEKAKAQNDTLRVGVAGSAPFVILEEAPRPVGISVEVWRAVAESANIPYRLTSINNISTALNQLNKNEFDVIIGPISITSERAKSVRFTQPYFFSSLVIVSKVNDSNIWAHIAPFFSKSFFIAAGIFLFILAIVGTLIWLAEREEQSEHFPANHPANGIFNGIWFALVTMTTVGYGDMAPKTVAGKIIAGIWMVIALITATSLIAGISSTLTIGGLSSSTINTAEEMAGKRVSVVKGSTAEEFVMRYTGKPVLVGSLKEAFKMLTERKVDAIVYDRPQIMYYLKENPDKDISMSNAEYMPQRYGFALRMGSNLLNKVNVALLELQESGDIDEIDKDWLLTSEIPGL